MRVEKVLALVRYLRIVYFLARHVINTLFLRGGGGGGISRYI